MDAGKGPCTPCGGYLALSRARIAQGKWKEAEHASRRWVELQPEAPSAWGNLANVLMYTGRQHEGLEALTHAVTLSGNDPAVADQRARFLIMSRRFEPVDSIIAVWSTSKSSDLRYSAHDLRILLLRERGQYRAANAELDKTMVEFPATAMIPLTRGNNLGRLGDYAAAALTYERTAHHPLERSPSLPLNPTDARGFCWHHALLADAIAPSGDVRRLQGIADTLRLGCVSSFFHRDHLLYHHVLGLIALHEKRWADAEAQLRQAHFIESEGYTRTNVALAKAQLKLGRPRDAIASLRAAYSGPLDGMPRYQPRSELDYFMAVAFRAAGQMDSAAVYDAYAQRALRNADPEARRQMEAFAR
jgi:tetratricopeptide (TPR) repeat protein